MEDKSIDYQESLQLINSMISKAKNAYRDTGISAMLWGSVISICSFVKLAEVHFHFKLPFDIYLLTLLAIIPQVIISIKEKRLRKARSYESIFLDYIWLSFGISIFLLVHVINLAFVALQPVAAEYASLAGHPSSFKLSEFVMPLFLVLYGIPTFITGAACKFKPMLWGGILFWLCSVITVYTGYEADLLLTGLAAIAGWLIPGIILEKQHRLAKMKEGVLNV